MEDLPQTMRSLVAPRARCTPADYLIQDMPVPSIAMPTQVLMRMHAASVGPGNSKPWQASWADLSRLTHVPASLAPGFVSDYAVAEERFLLRKPPTMSWEEAAGAPGSVVTALQTIRRGLQLGGLENLEGKTVFVPAGLGATGSVAIQVAKNVFGAARIITTVSTAKVPLVERYLPGMVDQVIDYQTQKIQDVVPPGSVDFMYNTTFATLDDGIPLLNPTTGILMSIASLPSKAVAREIVGADRFPWLLGAVLDLLQLQYWWKLRGTGIRYEFVSGGPQIREDLEWAGEVVARGKVKPVVTSVDFDDLPAVQKGCEATRTGKGGIGKFAMRIK
ncbi:hypothetical protein ACCO45_006639 [Purpureocillium lilacinum]|uniref:Uncharacterized protein n=1 Tax=Purpureocillium lilacinum TaxID=33203 RepID=A0ACC4DQ36_PURLI